MKKLLVAAMLFVVLAGGLIGCKSSSTSAPAPTGGAGPTTKAG